MAIQAQNKFGWIVDHQKALDSAVQEVYCEHGHNRIIQNYRSLPDQFATHTPFLMDSEFSKKQKLNTASTRQQQETTEDGDIADISESKLSEAALQEKSVEDVSNLQSESLYGIKSQHNEYVQGTKRQHNEYVKSVKTQIAKCRQPNVGPTPVLPARRWPNDGPALAQRFCYLGSQCKESNEDVNSPSSESAEGVNSSNSESSEGVSSQQEDPSTNANDGKLIARHEVDQPRETHVITPAKKKRKRKSAYNAGELAAMELHTKVIPVIQKAYEQLVQLSRSQGLFLSRSTDVTPEDNNRQAREAAQTRGPGDTLSEMSAMAKDVMCMDATPNHVTLPTKIGTTPVLFGSLVENTADQALMCPWMGGDYIVPALSRFLMSDIQCLQPLTQDTQLYDLIVIDPPWENKSVKRKKKYMYDTLPDWRLLDIPLEELAAPDALVVVWVTNRVQHQIFVKEKWFPKFDIQYLGEWYWLKVTRFGEPVQEISMSLLKKPYETLLLGRVKHKGESVKEKRIQSVPSDLVIMSVPSSLHSRKPPLKVLSPEYSRKPKSISYLLVPCRRSSPGHQQILSPYLPRGARCLEMFARSLMPGWTSWGNEVLKFQHTDYFIKV